MSNATHMDTEANKGPTSPNVGEVLLADLSDHALALRAAQGSPNCGGDINSQETLLDVAARRLERMSSPSVASEMMDWAESHAEKTRSILEIESDKPLLFWGVEKGRQRDKYRKAADVAMAALRKRIAR